ncbi:MAG: MtnX-like HAD-IB family phosphatase [Bacteroidota bacterium]|nr:MtnX-like HAD-IB family phosphatase [Bacteroidota bacterium]MDP4232800.1 MtnX-like HAD-IB family phosphatase [Bacteroidota bacterium]MDP4242519.1 MtnX-like HAD-IB family phosphatase [Bacteroidota bacterium]MDP4289206.1 MtnX-like HAD-IB family phosphatase [Bacteroidota bacterium]
MYKVYSDFDETITTRDVGSQILARFGTPAAFEVWREFDRGEKTAAECLRIACATMTGANPEHVMALVAEQHLRDGFREFVAFCSAQSVDLRITSDGFSFYIDSILAQHRLPIPVWTNKIDCNEDGTLAVTFQNQREGCPRCASCKCAGLLTTSDDADTIVYIGDGYSDWCPALMADVVFATRDLKRQCGEHGIPHHPFEDFHEVKAILSTYLKERPKYRREQAHRRRKELIMME